MTWIDVRYALLMATLVAIGHVVIQVMWLGISGPGRWMISTVSVFFATLLVRAVMRAFGVEPQPKTPRNH